MPEENSLILHMHELLQFLNRQGASTFLTVAQHGLVGDMKAPVDVTYLADTVILLRYFEARGAVRRAISVIKKRTGGHEDTIREFRIDGGLHVGEPLVEFQGVLRGVPLILTARALPARPRGRASERSRSPAPTLRALVLAPRGRDAAARRVAARQAGMPSRESAATLPTLVAALDDDVGVRAADRGGDPQRRPATAVRAWLAAQPAWSDLPFVLVTDHGGGPERNPIAARWLEALGNVSFLERPFHPTTLVSVARATMKGRRRQHETRVAARGSARRASSACSR